MSNHAITRLNERNREFSQMISKIEDKGLKLKATYDFLKNSTEEKSFLNNSKFMIKIHEKYGYDKSYTFFANGNSLFVGVIEQSRNVIVTVLERNGHEVAHLREKPQKFKSKNNEKIGVYFPPGRS